LFEFDVWQKKTEALWGINRRISLKRKLAAAEYWLPIPRA